MDYFPQDSNTSKDDFNVNPHAVKLIHNKFV